MGRAELAPRAGFLAGGLSDCKVLEIGSNRGGFSLWLASQSPQVVHSDYNELKDEAVRRHQAGGVSHLVQRNLLALGDKVLFEHIVPDR